MTFRPVHPESLTSAIRRVEIADRALLAVGRPACPACELLEVSLGVIAAARPDLVVVSIELATPEDWSARETLLWPRGIRVSRASMPTLVLLRDGAAVDHRHAGGPAAEIDAWLATYLGPGTTPLTGVSAFEREALGEVEHLRRRHLALRSARSQLD